MMYILTVLGCVLLVTVSGQNLDPKVTITETDPPSEGARVKGIITTDILLSCYVEDLPPNLQVRWQRTMFDKDGKETTQDISTDMAVEDNSKWSIEKPSLYTWRLRIKSLSVPDEGNYTCFVRLTINNNRVESNRTVLSYSYPIIIEEQSSSNTFVKEGDFVPLRCNATGRPAPNMIWRRQGNAILPGGGVRHMGAALDITDIEYTARGLYICEAFNDVGLDRRDITLGIQHSPKLFPDPPRVGQAVGYQRTLTCHVEANPMASIEEGANQVWWMKGSQAVVQDNTRETRYIVGAYGRLTVEMVIYHVQNDDYGQYVCYAKTNLGQGNAAVELYETDEPQADKRNAISCAPIRMLSICTMWATLLMALTQL